jgi:hypothetical protein
MLPQNSFKLDKYACMLPGVTICAQSVRTAGVCRVLTIPRSVYNSLVADFPLSSSVVLDNLVARAEEVS